MIPAFIISDLHLGNALCRCAAILAFLDHLPSEATLILNGDVVDRSHQPLPPAHVAVLDRLRAESARREVIWVRGNHDARYEPTDAGHIQFRDTLIVDGRLYVAHGHEFDNVMPYHRAFIRAFRLLHRLRIALGGDSVHVAEFAKRFPRLYSVLRRSVSQNAVESAREHGCTSVTCGHTHYAEDEEIRGIRYVNTGAWTESPSYCLAVTATAIRLMVIGADGAVLGAHGGQSPRQGT